MKKLMTLMLGAALAFGAVSAVYAGQDQPKKSKAKSTKKSTKAPKKSEEKK